MLLNQISGEPILLQRVLREIIKRYLTFESQCSQSGRYEIEYAGVTINFLDLQGCLRALSQRKKEAIFLYVIQDKLQKEVADLMGIQTVTVGQYTEAALIDVGQRLWPEHASYWQSIADAKQRKEQAKKIKILQRKLEDAELEEII